MGIQVYRRISFQQTHDTIRDLSYVCSGLFSKPILCFVFSCGIRVASMSSVDSIPFKRCSHISMGVLILLIIEIVLSILFNQHVSLQVDPIISTSPRSSLGFSQCCSFHLSPSCLCFPAHPPLFLRGLKYLNQVSILFV